MPSGTQPWDNAHRIEGGLNGIGPDGRPVVPERYRPREPFLAVDSEEPYTYGIKNRVEKPHERGECAPARRRREVQASLTDTVDRAIRDYAGAPNGV